MRIKKLSELTNKSKQRKEKADESKGSKETSASSTQEEQKLSERVGDNLSRMKKALEQSTDLVVREFRISIEEKFTLGVAYIDGLVNKDEVEHYALDSIMHYHDEHLTHYDGIADEQVIQEVKERLSKIDIDGTPFVLMVPALFIQFFQAAEDYYQRADISTLIRLMRYMAFFLALLTPSAYIALTTFHQEMLPFALLISIAAQREGVPFPAIIEAFIMEITFEILREAGVRLPRAVGSAISIVGALVLGEAAVQAGLVSPAMVIVVSITAISNFVSPVYDMAIAVRMLRFTLMVLAATFGLFGIILGLILMILHLCSLRSFGVPYMTPMAPFVKRDQKDVIRRSIKKMKTRPKLINEKNISRQKTQKN
ncbi:MULTISPECIES: spore germination protein [Priestia]|uniref:spore germination protein n=1 Tax=Priestia TaxID=2800373 RepID=UPI00372D6E25